jgi:anti-sigma regulatory factor (Ser/Thr protein kinase)
MDCSISRKDKEIRIEGVLAGQGFRWLLAVVYEAVRKRGYEEVVLDFSKCAAAFPIAMLPVCANALRLRSEGINTELVLPTDEHAARRFVRFNWAGIIDPQHPIDVFKGYVEMPATRFRDASEQKDVVDRLMGLILKSTPDLERADFAAVEWALSELTDNVVNHSGSKIGGLVQFTHRRQSKRLDVVICDAGMGVPAKIMPAFPRLPNEMEALSWAIKEGVTSNPESGQGNGLFGSSEIAKLSGGYFSLHSAHASLFLNDTEGLRLRNEKIPYDGAVVDMCMSYAIPNVLASALKFEDIAHSPTDYIFLRYQSDSEDGALRFNIFEEAASLGSRAAGKPIRQQLANLIRMTSDPVRVDFGDRPVISSSFADEAIAKLVIDVGEPTFRQRIRLLRVTPTVRAIISRAISQRTKQAFEV